MRGRGYEAVKVAAEIAVPIAIVVVWELWARSADSQFWPPPSKIVQEFMDLWVFEQFRCFWRRGRKQFIGFSFGRFVDSNRCVHRRARASHFISNLRRRIFHLFRRLWRKRRRKQR